MTRILRLDRRRLDGIGNQVMEKQGSAVRFQVVDLVESLQAGGGGQSRSAQHSPQLALVTQEHTACLDSSE